MIIYDQDKLHICDEFTLGQSKIKSCHTLFLGDRRALGCCASWCWLALLFNMCHQ